MPSSIYEWSYSAIGPSWQFEGTYPKNFLLYPVSGTIKRWASYPDSLEDGEIMAVRTSLYIQAALNEPGYPGNYPWPVWDVAMGFGGQTYATQFCWVPMKRWVPNGTQPAIGRPGEILAPDPSLAAWVAVCDGIATWWGMDIFP